MESLFKGKTFVLLAFGECGFGFVNDQGFIVGRGIEDSEVPSEPPNCGCVFPGLLKSRGKAAIPLFMPPAPWAVGVVTEIVWSAIPCLLALCVLRKYLLQIHLLHISHRTRIWFGDFRGVIPVDPLGSTLFAVKPDAASCTGFHFDVATAAGFAIIPDCGAGGGGGGIVGGPR